MKGEYRLFKVYKGIPTFAWVWVEIEPLPFSSKLVIEAHINGANVDEGEVSAKTNSAWIDAAMIGVRKALEYLVESGKIKRGWKVRISKLVGNPVDTSIDSIECAAMLATWLTLLPGEPEPALRYSQRWVVDFEFK
jgi:hypothetical protein